MIRDSGVAFTINAFPSGGEQAGRPFLGVQGFLVSAFSENQLLAQTVLTEVFATPEFMQAMYDADPRPSANLAVREGTSDADLASFAHACHPRDVFGMGSLDQRHHSDDHAAARFCSRLWHCSSTGARRDPVRVLNRIRISAL
jgi:hypothetical protein